VRRTNLTNNKTTEQIRTRYFDANGASMSHMLMLRDVVVKVIVARVVA